jgi:DUF1680 family protein
MKTAFPFCAALLVLAGAAFAQNVAPTNSAVSPATAAPRPLYVVAGVDRDVVLGGKTYLMGYAGYSDPAPRRNGGGARPASAPGVQVVWSKESGPGTVSFASAAKTETTATFSEIGTYVLKLTGKSEGGSGSSTLTVKVAEPPPKDRLDVVYTKNYTIDNPLWNDRAKSLIVGWIPHCIDEINQPELPQGGINNFIEAGKRLQRIKEITPEETNLLPSQILVAEVVDFPGLAAKLKQKSTPAAELIWNKLDPETQAALNNGANPDAGKKALVANLNKLLVLTNLYDTNAFQAVKLRNVTAAAARPAVGARRGGGARGGPNIRAGERLAYANRLLLEDAFPAELAKVPQKHIGYPFSNAWVHQTVESMCIALMVDAKDDPDMLAAQQKMRETLETWIPIILAAQEPDGYLQTRFTLGADGDRGPVYHWNPATRSEHEGYVSGYFIESAINHYTMTGGKDTRLYDAAKRLADCWVANLGPGKKTWFDGHQEMEQALVRFGRFVNDMEGNGRGDSYIKLAKFLLDSRQGGSEYDQSHLPMIEQYEAVGHAVRAAYTYSGMADVAAETHDTDYQSAVLSLWDNIVNKKYYVTGGIGSGETSEGFGPNYSLRNNAYCESCSTCGLIFFQYKMNLAYHDAKYADLYEESLYNALLGATDEDGKNFFYDNPLVGGTRTPWHVCPCCVGNIPRTLLMIPTWTYARGDDGLYVNLYIGSTINVEKVATSAGKTDVQMVQKTDYPWKGGVAITVNPKQSGTFAVYVRVPNRKTSELYQTVPEVKGLVSLAVNGEKITPVMDKGYAVIKRAWKAGDKIDLELPLEVQRVTADAKIGADRGLETLRYGPLLYNVERADNGSLSQPIGTGPLQAVWKPKLLHGVMAISGTWADGSPLLAIPNYARNNHRDETTPTTADDGGPRSEVWFPAPPNSP